MVKKAEVTIEESFIRVLIIINGKTTTETVYSNESGNIEVTNLRKLSNGDWKMDKPKTITTLPEWLDKLIDSLN